MESMEASTGPDIGAAPPVMMDLLETESDVRSESTETSESLVPLVKAASPSEITSNNCIRSDKEDSILPVEGLFSEVDDSKVAESEPNPDEVLSTIESKEPKMVNREMKSLIDSAKDSKIISEFTQTKTKMRKSKQLDSSIRSTGSPAEAEKIQTSRRSSNNSLVSNSSDLSEKTTQKRSMRSLNPEFVYKNKKFLSSLTGKHQERSSTTSDTSDDEQGNKNESAASSSKKSKSTNKEKKTSSKSSRSDEYCWRCHWIIEPSPTAPAPANCSLCPRSFHPKCLGSERLKACMADPSSWVCSECIGILNAENSETRSPALQRVPVRRLCDLLKIALFRMKAVNGVDPFLYPVDRTEFPDYDRHVVHPMDLSLIEQNIAAGRYGSTEAFVADTLWILHNTFIFNTSSQSRLTGAARSLVRACRTQMSEIEACPECYAAAHSGSSTWFTDVCPTPHILLWAKLKGYPYWPAKGMSVNGQGMVDVRFFGAHDRAWVPARDCFLYCEEDPNNILGKKTKRQNIANSVMEVEEYIRNVSRKFGKFVHAPPQVQYLPAMHEEQLRFMIPLYEGTVRTTTRRSMESSNSSNGSSPAFVARSKRPRTKSKGSKPIYMDDSNSEEDALLTVQQRKMANGAEIAREEDDLSVDGEKRENSMEVDAATEEATECAKQRRSSYLHEAVITILEKKNEPNKRRRTSSGLVEATIEVLPPKDKNTDSTETSKDDSTPSARCTEKTVRNIVQEYKKIFPSSKNGKSPKRGEKEKDEVSNNDELGSKSKEANTKVNIESNEEIGNINAQSNEKESVEKRDENKSGNKDQIANEKESNDMLKSAKDRIIFSDDLESNSTKESDLNRLPTITNICSLSNAEKITEKENLIEVPIVETIPESVFKASATQVANLEDARAKLEKLRNPTNHTPSTSMPRVNVRKFARTTSPPIVIDIQVKKEPDDNEKTASDKNDLLSCLNLRPTNATDNESPVTWNEVVRLPKSTTQRVQDLNERPRARKTFPVHRVTSPQKDETRNNTELNGKNSMVYIPIQPASTQPPPRQVRPAHRPVSANPTRTTTVIASAPSTAASSVLISPASRSSPAPASAPTLDSATRLPAPNPNNLIPVISTVDGQWTILHPIVAAEINDTPATNGTGERMSPDHTTTINTYNVPVETTSINAVANSTTSVNNTTTANNTTTVSNTNTNSRREPPPLQARPGHPLDPNTSVCDEIPTPSVAGPATALLNQSAVKLADYFRKLLTDSLELVEEPEATVASLRLQLEEVTWKHKQELAELKHNADLQLLEMRMSLEKEKAHVLAESRRTFEQEFQSAINSTKSKQWCVNCRKEAHFYCCWNTSYCDYSCQKVHWQHHSAVCLQQRTDGGTTVSEEPNQSEGASSQGEMATITMGKSVPARLNFGNPQKRTPLITAGVMSGSRLTNYNQQVYISKQMIPDDTVAKMTPGGYLIVGAGSAGQAAILSQNKNA